MTANICFVSGHMFGHSALRGLLESDEYGCGRLRISLLLSLDAGRRNSTVGFCDFSDLSIKYSLNHQAIRSVKHAEVVGMIESSTSDYLLVIGWSELVPGKILDIPRAVNNSNDRHARTHGCIGMHPTLLPQGRGRAPIPWTIIKGLQETGVTVFLLEDAADAGGIVLQAHIPIRHDETATTLFAKCAEAHYNLSLQLAGRLAGRSLSWVDQDLSKVSIWPKRRPEDGQISFGDDIESIDRLVRALTEPYPGAFFQYRGCRVIVNGVRIHRTVLSEGPGTIVGLSSEGLPCISALNGTIECLSIRCPESGIPEFLLGTSVVSDQRKF